MTISPPSTSETQTRPPSRSDETRRPVWLFGILFVVVPIDQLLKVAIVAWLGPDADTHRWELAGRLVAFEYVENRGAAFGMLPDQTTLLTIVAIAITAGAIVFMLREVREHPVGAFGIGLLVGGALGNILDRIRLGYVVDFIAIGIWPRFNLADTMITVGIALLLWSGFREGAGGTDEKDATTVRPENQQGSVNT